MHSDRMSATKRSYEAGARAYKQHDSHATYLRASRACPKTQRCATEGGQRLRNEQARTERSTALPQCFSMMTSPCAGKSMSFQRVGAERHAV
jgi:hypothetical protein